MSPDDDAPSESEGSSDQPDQHVTDRWWDTSQPQPTADELRALKPIPSLTDPDPASRGSYWVTAPVVQELIRRRTLEFWRRRQHTYAGRRLDNEDLSQAITKRLLFGAPWDKWDPTSGPWDYYLNTRITYLMKSELRRYETDTSEPTFSRHLITMRVYLSERRNAEGPEPTIAEIAVSIGLPEDEVRQLLLVNQLRQVWSLDTDADLVSNGEDVANALVIRERLAALDPDDYRLLLEYHLGDMSATSLARRDGTYPLKVIRRLEKLEADLRQWYDSEFLDDS